MRLKLETSNPSVDRLQELISNGFKYYLLDTQLSNGTDPWSGMPNTKSSMFLFDNKNEAIDFMPQVTANPFNPDLKPEIKSLDDLLAGELNRADNIKKNKEKADKRRQARQALPAWRKTRSNMLNIRNEINSYKKALAELEKLFNEQSEKLSNELESAGVKFDSIDQVLSREFLK